MKNITVKPYELSIWLDKQWFVCKNTNNNYIVVKDKDSVPEGYDIVNDFIREIPLGVVGGNEINTPISAYDVQLKQNINGSNELTFIMPLHYWDNDSNKLLDNPWNTLLTTEQKIKLKYTISEDDIRFYDFVIKKISENANNHTRTFNCTDLFIEELSKNGYDISLTNEALNNTGTANELAETVLKDSEWSLHSSSESIRESVSEQLLDYELQANETKVVTVMRDFEYDGIQYTAGQTFTLTYGDHLYLFYSSYTNQENPYQLMYSKTGQYIADSSSILINAANCTTPYFPWAEPPISKYRGQKLVTSQKGHYIPSIQKFVYEYNHTETVESVITTVPYYCIKERKFISSDQIQDLISNNISFVSTDGWYISDSSLSGSRLYINRETVGEENKNVLQVTFGSGTYNWVGNSGFQNAVAKLTDGLVNQEKYEFLINSYTGGSNISSARLIVNIPSSGSTPQREVVFNFAYQDDIAVGTKTYRRYETTIDNSINYSDLARSTIDFRIYGTASTITKILDAKLFKKEMIGTTLVVPDAEGIMDTIYQDYYKLFKQSTVLTTYADLTCEYSLTSLDSTWTPINQPDYAKIGTITAEKSNRFNILQTIAEQFRCWVKFTIGHDSIGNILYNYNKTPDERYYSGKTYYQHNGRIIVDLPDEQFNIRTGATLDAYFIPIGNSTFDTHKYYYYKETDGEYSVPDYYYQALTSDQYTLISDPTKYYYLDSEKWNTSTLMATNTVYEKQYEKYVSFHEYIGQRNYSGFKYGINIDNITRQVDSDRIITKLMVPANTQQSDESDTQPCTIANAEYNPIKENFLVNFDYYIHQGILDEADMLRDLYDEAETGGIAYITKLGKLNKDNKELISKKADLTTSKTLANASYQKYLEAAVAAETEKNNYNNYLTGQGFEPGADGYYVINAETDNDSVQDWKKGFNTEWTGQKEYEVLRDQYNERVNTYTNSIDSITLTLNTIVKAKEGLNTRFNSKYSRYIREGSWLNDTETNNNRYYINAQNVLYNSSYPQVTYNITVTDVSALNEYRPYTFRIGDETTIEDTEFFGYDDNGRPYQERVIVTEITSNLDNPSKNQLTIKNYDNKWDSLFQRIQASTDSLTFHEGEYNRVADTVDDDGTLKSSFLKNTFSKNQLLANSINDEIATGQGIQLINATYPEKEVRIGSDGIAIKASNDKGWMTAITGDGINASILNSGQLNTEVIKIYGGANASFIWDKDNLRAYAHDGTTRYINKNKYVEFNQYGIAAYNNSAIIPAFKLEPAKLELNSVSTADQGYIKFNSDGEAESSGSTTRYKIMYAGYKTRVGEQTVENDVFKLFSNGDMTLEGEIYAKQFYVHKNTGFVKVLSYDDPSNSTLTIRNETDGSSHSEVTISNSALTITAGNGTESGTHSIVIDADGIRFDGQSGVNLSEYGIYKDTTVIGRARIFSPVLISGSPSGLNVYYHRVILDGEGGLTLQRAIDTSESVTESISVAQLSFDRKGTETTEEKYDFPFLRLGQGSASSETGAVSKAIVLKKFKNSIWLGSAGTTLSYGAFPGLDKQGNDLTQPPEDDTIYERNGESIVEGTHYTGLVVWYGNNNKSAQIYSVTKGTVAALNSGVFG